MTPDQTVSPITDADLAQAVLLPLSRHVDEVDAFDSTQRRVIKAALEQAAERLSGSPALPRLEAVILAAQVCATAAEGQYVGRTRAQEALNALEAAFGSGQSSLRPEPPHGAQADTVP